MKKPDFSKAAIQKFFLYHAEKLVLLFSLLLLGFFFWMGLKSPVFREKTPDQLSKMAENADRHIRSDTSWESIKDFRKGKHDVVDVITKAAGNLTPEKFNIDSFTGAVAKKADSRKDPDLFHVIEPHAITFKAPLIVKLSGPVKTDPFAEFPSPPNSGVESARPGGFGGEFRVEEFMNEESDEEGERAGGRFGIGSGKKNEPEEDELPVLDAVGTEMRMVHVHEAPGMRRPLHQIPSTSSKSYLFDVVCVTGLVDFKQQWNSFDKSFSSSIGYYPDRDKPIFQHLQVERREVDDQGNPLKTIDPKTKKPAGEWSDQSELILHKVPRRFPDMHQMPKAMYSSAPDIVAPENFDPVLTGPIPPIVMFDYLPLVNHPKLADKMREFPDVKEDEALIPQGPNNIFQVPEEGEAGFGFGSGPGGSPGSQGLERRRGGAGSRARSMGSPSRSTLDEEKVATRYGSDFTDYWKALEANNPTHDYRLVRFFDVLAKQGRSYEYRMRVWVGDPNNEDLQGTFAQLQDGLEGPSNRNLNQPGDERESGEEMGRDFSPRNFSPTRTGARTEPEPEKAYVKVPIGSQMLDPTVRIRLNRAREVADPKTRKKSYFVSEVRDKDAEGKDIVEEVAVPKDRPYLRFARPSQWSQPVRIKVKNRTSQVVAGGVEPPKMARLKIGQTDKYFPITEPVSEVVASVWSDKLGTAMPTKQKVYRGDALNFNAPAYVLHPITWQVLIAKNTSTSAEGGAKFLFDIDTGNVLVDAMGGGELPLPRAEKMRHALPGEILVMDELGEFHVRNDLADKTVYRNLLFLPDESQIVGRSRAPKKTKEEEMQDRFGDRDNPDF